MIGRLKTHTSAGLGSSMAVILALEKLFGTELCEFEASLVLIMNSGTAVAM